MFDTSIQDFSKHNFVCKGVIAKTIKLATKYGLLVRSVQWMWRLGWMEGGRAWVWRRRLLAWEEVIVKE